MKNTSESARNLTKLLKKLPAPVEPEYPDWDDPIAIIVLAFMMAESTTSRAIRAYEKLKSTLVDFNELRVCMPDELAAIIGSTYPLGYERCDHLRSTLRDIFQREHATSLDRLADWNKRDIRQYVETLDGITPYVIGRLLLLGYDAHAVPVDEQLRQKLIAQGVCDEDADLAELTSWLTRQIKADDALDVHLQLQRWVERGSGRRRAAPRSSAGRKTTTSRKKTTGRSSAGR